MEGAPDLIVLPSLGYEIAANVSDEGRVWATPEIINGPEVKGGVRLQGADIYDVAPTILAIKDIPIPDDMDGRVLVEAMVDPSRYEDVERVAAQVGHEVEHKFTEEEEAALQDRLRSLGYM